jgi:type IV pilus assembly protein PilQ
VDVQNFVLNFRVTPVISSDNSIRLDLNVSRSNPASGAVVNGRVTTSSSAAQTKVIVGNNQTAVIGGIYTGSETSTVRKVPILGDIPILGWLFKSKGAENTKTELVIFVTPRIIDQSRVITETTTTKQVLDEQGTGTATLTPKESDKSIVK